MSDTIEARFRTRVVGTLPEDLLEDLEIQVERASTGARLTGQLFQVLRPREFFPAAIAGSPPPQGSFAPFVGAATVEVVLVVAGVTIPLPMSTVADSTGHFVLLLPPLSVGSAQVRVRITPLSGGPQVLVYRSAPIDMDLLSGKDVKIFFFPLPVPDTIGVTQAQVNEQVAAAHATEDLSELDTLSAAIVEGGLRVTATRKRATVTFKLLLKASQAVSLERFISHEITSFSIDLPALAGCFLNEDKLEKQIRDGIADMVKAINAGIDDTLIAALAESSDQDPEAMLAAFNEHMTLTFMRARFPVVQSGPGMGGSTTQELRNIVFEPSFGFPRKLG